MIQALIFDLDSCLAPATEIGPDIVAPVFQAIRDANQGAVTPADLEAAFTDCWRFPFDFVAEKYGFSPAMRAAGYHGFRRLEVLQPLSGYGDLAVLADLPGKLFLVTTGFRRLQESKIRALGIAPRFTGIFIDAIDAGPTPGKRPIFANIMQTQRLRPAEVLVVGDNPDSEIAAGNQLGLTTIQMLRPGVAASEAAAHRVRNLHELKAFCAAKPE
ncbi:MAG TPA: HAD family hydrolase [Verrucomicrobiota bacterium]|nr:HAD family hydrolase [Verrucomicrobiota bacterium]HNT15604.1 HAD family hydrolase [Verrucomicrobiota bacterium]